MDQTTATPVVRSRSRVANLLSDYGVLIKRSLLHIIKSPDQLLGTLFQPIMFTLLFVFVFGGAINTGGVSYVNYLIAGVLVQTVAFGATMTAFEVANDMQRGIIERLKSLPIASSGVLVGHITADIVRNFASAIVMIIVALIVGFRPEASFTDWLLVFGILGLFTFAISWLSAILGLLAKSVEAVQWLTFVIVFPLTFASSAFVPLHTMAPGIRAFAENQPMTHVIEAVRGLLIGTPIGNHGWLAVVWCVGILVIAFPIAVRLFANKTTR